jgi:hypothetical protein
LLCALLGTLALWPGMSQGGSEDAVAFVQGLQSHHRVVLVTADEAHLPHLERQAARFGEQRESLSAEQVVLVLVRPDGVTAGSRHQFDADAAQRLRAFYDLEGDGFAVLLIGRDGGEKARFTEVVDAADLLAHIDDAPARGEEARQVVVL